jgi:hypothetical protein
MYYCLTNSKLELILPSMARESWNQALFKTLSGSFTTSLNSQFTSTAENSSADQLFEKTRKITKSWFKLSFRTIFRFNWNLNSLLNQSLKPYELKKNYFISREIEELVRPDLQPFNSTIGLEFWKSRNGICSNHFRSSHYIVYNILVKFELLKRH